MESRSRLFWGVALVLLGGMLLTQQLGLIPFNLDFGMFLFGIPAVLFIMVFVSDRRQWWALIPGSVLTGLTLVVFNSQNHIVSDEQAGALFLFSIALPFLLIYTLDRRMWWALIPGGVLTVLAFMPLIANIGLSGEVTGGLFFMGLGAVFALLRVATLPNPNMAWAWWPAAILGVFGAFILLTGTVASQIFWPVALIGLGLLILARGYLPRSPSNESSAIVKSDDANTLPPNNDI
jgi:hypothetical protein